MTPLLSDSPAPRVKPRLPPPPSLKLVCQWHSPDSSRLGLPHRDAVSSERRPHLRASAPQEACGIDTSAAKQSAAADTMEGTYGTAFPPNASPM